MDESTLYAIIQRFGWKAQVAKLQEESLELALALNKVNCRTKNQRLMEAQLYEELADMKIMMAQVDLLFDKSRIDAIVAKKLKRFKDDYL